jgi:hypothetical protein
MKDTDAGSTSPTRSPRTEPLSGEELKRMDAYGRPVRGESGAPAAEAKHVYSMRPHSEPSFGREGCCRPLDGSLETDGGGKILDGAARGANQVVMVFRQILGQLVPGGASRCDQPPDHPGLLQHHQVPVHGALGEARARAKDVVDGQRLRRRANDLDELPSQWRVSLPPRPEALHDHVFHVGLHGPRG